LKFNHCKSSIYGGFLFLIGIVKFKKAQRA